MIDVIEEFARHIKRLRDDESGVALMLTLSVFLLLYVVCAGIYSIGETVRQKIEVQMACDAAAHSAAVVQADGLSRMAMVNRALSWSYVQLTNMQMDYITYKWLQLVSSRFHEDESKCAKHNKSSIFEGSLPAPCIDYLAGHLDDWYVGEDKGWFCGKVGLSSLVGGGFGQLDVNGRTRSITDIDEVIDPNNKQFRDILKFGEKVESADPEGGYIQQFKDLIGALNLFLPLLNEEMQNAIYATASSVLFANLPHDLRDKMNSDFALTDPMDISKGRDFVWYVKQGVPMDPYEEKTDNARNGDGLYFDPLYNTELDERIFLSMADGAVYDNLQDYFYASSGLNTKGLAGGLDQWFVRGDTNETQMSYGPLPIHIDVKRSYRNLGICRVYKNTNRADGGKVSRGHHSSIEPFTECDPSCFHSRKSSPDQCASVPDNTCSLYADYEWGSMQVITVCYTEFIQIGRVSIPYKTHHIQTGIPLTSCPHTCCQSLNPLYKEQHTRASYNGSCFVSQSKMAAAAAAVTFHESGHVGCHHPHIDIVARMKPLIYGFSRTYGDDKAIYDLHPEAYVGTPAKPWILNERFYERDGTIVVGLARRLRNPWVWLLNQVVPYEKVDEGGIYSAFNPIGAENAVVGFSAARAAHRYNPTTINKNGRSRLGIAQFKEAGMREYETRYDSVCADDWNLNRTHPKIEISSGLPGGELEKLRIGCVCGKKNAARFANCWNLCETDWDATLLPLRYAWATTTPWFDSHDHPDGSVPELVWETVDGQNERFSTFESLPVNVLYAAALESWSPFWDENGVPVFERAQDDRGHLKTPLFLRRFDPRELLKAKFL